jgi:hypothetical protein
MLECLGDKNSEVEKDEGDFRETEGYFVWYLGYEEPLYPIAVRSRSLFLEG